MQAFVLERRDLDYLAKLRRHECPNRAMLRIMSTLEIILLVSVAGSGSAAFVYAIWRDRASGRRRQGNPERLRRLIAEASDVR